MLTSNYASESISKSFDWEPAGINRVSKDFLLVKSLLEAFERSVFEKFIFEVITMKSLLVSWKNITLLFIQEFVLVENYIFFFVELLFKWGHSVKLLIT